MKLLTNAMLFVLPSDLEGLSLALLDAMAAAICVLASDVPENREVVDGTGFTFERGNATDLGERLQFLIANPAIREAAGKAAQWRIRDRYSWPIIAADIERVYFTVMAEPMVKVPKKPSTGVVAPATKGAAASRKAG